MAKPLFELNVDINKDFYQSLKLIKQWPDRLKNIEPMIGYMAADYIKRFVKAKLPPGAAYKAYRTGLEVVKVKGLKNGEYAYAVQINQKNPLVKKVEVQKTLLYVHPSKRAIRPSEKVKILEKFNPWTYDTLPFTPEPREGYIVNKPARGPQVRQIGLLRQSQRTKWRTELEKVGVREGRKDLRLKLPKSVTNLPDVALDALKLEFGLGGKRPFPAWRLGFSKLSRQGFAAFLKDKRLLAFPLTRPSFNLWKKWPQKTENQISTAQAKKYTAFQKKVVHRS